MRVLAAACTLAAALAAALASPAPAAAPVTKAPGRLLVSLSLAAPPFQAGAVRRGEVVLAKGFEVEVARALARRLGLRRVTFLNEPRPERLLAPGRKRWDVALARVTPGPGGRVAYSSPYFRADQLVLLRRGLDGVATLASLRPLQLCVLRGTGTAPLVERRVRPRLRPLLAGSPEALARALQTGRCDAAVGGAAEIGALLRDDRRRFGAVAGRIESPTAYAAVLERGSPLLPLVDRALARLAADGTLGRLARSWLGVDPSRARPLR
jgi:ABC-type amino acid transport substrate-binding protein